MYFKEERINRILKEIKNCIHTDRHEINNLQVRYGEIKKNTDLHRIEDGWQHYCSGTPWTNSSSDSYALFKAVIAIPDSFDGKKAVLKISTNRSGWNALNPQMLLYINGGERQAFDTNHMLYPLDENAKAGSTYEAFIYAFSGLSLNNHHDSNVSDVVFHAELLKADPLVEEFYYNLYVPFQLLAQLPQDSAERVRILGALNEAVNLIDMRIDGSQEFYRTIKEANEFIKKNLYGGTGCIDASFTCIGHTHIDVAWLWRFCHTREKAVRSFTTALMLMEQYPEYIFFSSQPQLYEFVKEDHPEVYRRIRERVSEGRWEAEGGMWVEADTNVPSGESLVRQFLFGKSYFREEFGVENRILWLPDVFGYSGNLPQIMKKSGIDYFMTSKLAYNEINRFPYHTFNWKGIDGTEVLAHLVIYSDYGYNCMADAKDFVQGWKKYAQKDINNDLLLPCGYGDGGGGTTPEMLESVRRYNKGLPGAPRAGMGTALQFFDRLSERVKNSRELPKWVGELYFENHRGTYTSMARNKKKNRKAEFLYLFAESMSVVNHLLFGCKYPSEELHDGWKSILLNQFHDVLPGSSIKEVYEDTDRIYENVFGIGNRVLKEGLDRISAAVPADSPSLVVFNQLSWERTGLVEFEYPSDKGISALENAEGVIFPCQKSSESGHFYVSVIKGAASKGYERFKLVENTGDRQGPDGQMKICRELLENRFFRITLNPDGTFSGLFDKKSGREVLKPGENGNVLQAFEDKPRYEDNWNLDIYYSEKMWEINGCESIEVIEAGPVRGILRVTKKFLDSSIMQDITIYSDIPRIDFKTVIDWKEKDITLKVMFPVDVNSDKAAYEIQYGFIERNTHWNTSWDIAKFEVCGHKWADLSEDGCGVSLLNDCKYGYDIKEGRLRLTLLRCGCIPNPAADKEVHEFTYSLYPHSGGWREGKVVQEAYDLNCPLTGRVITKQEGRLPEKLSLVRTNCDNVIAEAVKKAEKDEDIILRVYEAYNRRCEVCLEMPMDIDRVTECDLMENEMAAGESINPEGGRFVFAIRPLEIKTFKVRFKTQK